MRCLHSQSLSNLLRFLTLINTTLLISSIIRPDSSEFEDVEWVGAIGGEYAVLLANISLPISFEQRFEGLEIYLRAFLSCSRVIRNDVSVVRWLDFCTALFGIHELFIFARE